MKPNQIYSRMIVLFVLLLMSGQAHSKIILPSIFTTNMVLQQKSDVAFWGKAGPGKNVVISVDWTGKNYTAKADAQGNWKTMVSTPSFGGPYKVTVSDGQPVTLTNVMIGEVWLCSGQSNMEMPLAGWGKIDRYKEEIANANFPNIRLFQAEKTTSTRELSTFPKISNGGWTICSPVYIADFSSVAYFFARELYRKTGIPVGLIHTSWGGTVAEAWTSAATLKNMPDFAAAVEKVAATKSSKNYEQEYKSWKQLVFNSDKGKGAAGWLGKSTDDSSWNTMELPGYWDKVVLTNVDGIVYFRKKIVIPASWAGKAVKLHLGTIDDDDLTFFNGEKIGETVGYNIDRVYTIPGNKVKAGENVIAVRIFDGSGGGGMYGDKNVLALTSASGEKISLDGDWKYKLGIDLKDITAPPVSDNEPNRATVLYNAMIHPFTPYRIRGVIWYQGEANTDRADQYRTLFPALIKDWRNKWNAGDFPFYFVQLANFMDREPDPVGSQWAELRDAQLETLSLANTGMAVTIDIGEVKDIHPKNKQEVGRRLALIALAKNYGKKIAYSGPRFTSQQITGNTVELSFNFTEGGLVARKGELKGFAIAGADKEYYWAKAEIRGDKVIVSSDKVPNPVAVRYAWGNNPECNLYNGAGLPASPFRTGQ